MTRFAALRVLLIWLLPFLGANIADVLATQEHLNGAGQLAVNWFVLWSLMGIWWWCLRGYYRAEYEQFRSESVGHSIMAKMDSKSYLMIPMDKKEQDEAAKVNRSVKQVARVD